MVTRRPTNREQELQQQLEEALASRDTLRRQNEQLEMQVAGFARDRELARAELVERLGGHAVNPIINVLP